MGCFFCAATLDKCPANLVRYVTQQVISWWNGCYVNLDLTGKRSQAGARQVPGPGVFFFVFWQDFPEGFSRGVSGETSPAYRGLRGAWLGVDSSSQGP